MTGRTVKWLAAIVAGLILLLIAVQTGNNGVVGDPQRQGQKLLPALEAVANDISAITVRSAGEEGETRLQKADDQWVVATQDNYMANIGTLRELVVALADARIVEEKTGNPEQYGRLGVDDPSRGGDGVEIRITSGETDIAVVLGNAARNSFRYARVVGGQTSYLIDQNPFVPDSPEDWLQPEVLDIDPDDVKNVSIAHADGESLRIEKTDSGQGEFEFAAIPDGRELTYPGIGNSIASSLKNLQLEGVRKAVDLPADATLVLRTFDGLSVTVASSKVEDESWITVAAEASTEETGESDATEAADAINARVSGWQYLIPEFKANQLARRWDDVLKSTEAE